MWPDRKVALQRVAAGGVAVRTSGESEHFNEGPEGLGGSLYVISLPNLDSEATTRSSALVWIYVDFGRSLLAFVKYNLVSVSFLPD